MKCKNCKLDFGTHSVPNNFCSTNPKGIGMKATRYEPEPTEAAPSKCAAYDAENIKREAMPEYDEREAVVGGQPERCKECGGFPCLCEMKTIRRNRERDDVVQPTKCPVCGKPYVFISGIFRPTRSCNCPITQPETPRPEMGKELLAIQKWFKEFMRPGTIITNPSKLGDWLISMATDPSDEIVLMSCDFMEPPASGTESAPLLSNALKELEWWKTHSIVILDQVGEPRCHLKGTSLCSHIEAQNRQLKDKLAALKSKLSSLTQAGPE